MATTPRQIQCASQSIRRQQLWTSIVLFLPLFVTGCASSEHRYAVTNLPPELIANRLQLPFAADLSNSVARTHLEDIEPGDTVEISLMGGGSTDRISRFTTIVAADGTVMLPGPGRVSLSGMPLQLASDAVIRASSVSSKSSEPVVQVSIKEARQNRITVVGAVARPGVYLLPRNESDLVAALAMAGGIARNAGAKIVIQGRAMAHSSPTIPKDGSSMGEISDTQLTDSLAGSVLTPRREIDLTGAPAANHGTGLADGDVVVVEQSDVPSVMVTGTVNKPGRYEFPLARDFTVLEAVGMAGGIPNKVVDTVVVCRCLANQEEKALIQVSLHDATRDPSNDLLLMPGDIVSIEPTPKSLFKDTIRYIGSAAGGASMMVLLKR